MEYLPNITDQTRLFLLSLGFGFALGVLYDVFRIIRLLVNGSGRAGLLVQDILYCLCCTGCSFFFFLAVGDGTVRLYLLGGEILGWLVYYVSFGTVALRLSEWLVQRLRKFFRAAARMLATPFLRFLRLLEKSAVVLRKCRISLKRLKNNLHFGLHSSPNIVYNGSQTSLTKKKGNNRLAKQPGQKHRTAAKNRNISAQARVAQPYPQHHRTAGGARVRSDRRVPDAEEPPGRRRRGRKKRSSAAAD